MGIAAVKKAVSQVGIPAGTARYGYGLKGKAVGSVAGEQHGCVHYFAFAANAVVLHIHVDFHAHFAGRFVDCHLKVVELEVGAVGLHVECKDSRGGEGDSSQYVC